MSQCKIMGNRTSINALFMTVLAGFTFLSCMTSADIYTDSGNLVRPEIEVNADIEEVSLEPFSQNSISELKAELVDNVNLLLFYSLVKSENPDLLKKIAQVHVAEGIKIQSGILENPEFRMFINKIPLSSENSVREGSVGFRLLQPIDISGGISADKKVANALHLKATWDLIDAERKIKILAASAFFEYLLQTQILEKQGILESARCEQYEIIEKEVKAGKNTKVKLLEFHRLLTDSQLAHENTKLKLENSINAMKNLIGDFKLVFGAPVFNQKLDFTSLRKGDLASIVENHPAYLAATQQITAKEAEQTKLNGQHLKKLKIGVGYEYENDGANHWMNFLLEIPVPIWNFGKGTKYFAKAKVYIAKKQADAVLVNLLTEFENAFNLLQNLKSKQEIINNYLNEKRLIHQEIVKGQASVTTLFDVLESQVELTKYEIQALKIKLYLYKTYYFLYVSLNSKYPKLN